MPNDPRSITTFDLSQVYKSLGVRSPNTNVELDTSQLTPVIVMADMAQSFSPEQFQARGVSSIIGDFANDEFGTCELRSLGAGGIVIERLEVSTESDAVAAEDQTQLFLGTTPETIVSPVVPEILQIGGENARSTVVGGHTVAGHTPIGVQVQFPIVRNDISFGRFEIPFNWFIAPGQFFVVQNNAGPANAGTLTVNIQWREIPQARGQQ